MMPVSVPSTKQGSRYHRDVPDRAPIRVPFDVILVAVWAIPAALAVIETYTFARMSGRPYSLPSIVLREGATWATYGILAPLIFRLANRFPLRAPSVRSHLSVHVVGAILAGAVSAAMGTFVSQLTRNASDSAQFLTMSVPHMFLSWWLGDLAVAFLSYFAVVGVAHAMSYFREAQQRREDALRLESQLADARLAALQGRLHPHFLYNTLNAITVLVRDGDIRRSTRMLELLSTMLRRVLDGSLPQIVPLKTELALLRQYLEIEEVRFSDRLIVTIDVEPRASNAGVPALVTQPLAENVIRHAVANTLRHVTLGITARVTTTPEGRDILELTVSDDGPGLAAGWERRRIEHTGLSATALRITTLYGSDGSLEIRARAEGGTISTVRIPYVQLADNHDDELVAADDDLTLQAV
jgi:two-component system, LytTR family, sensor kinase